MDLYKIIRELYEERNRLDEVIRSLEALVESGEGNGSSETPKRRGRRGMSQEERLEVSRRMRKYWEARRQT